MCDDSDTIGPDFCSDTWRTARKVHKCCACSEAIPPGNRYWVRAGKWDGEFSTFKHCARCHLVYEKLIELLPGEYVDIYLDCGTVWEREHEVPMPEHLAFITQAEAQTTIRARGEG